MRDMVQPDCAYLIPTTTFIRDECFQTGNNDEASNGPDLAKFRIYLILDLSRFG